MAKLCHTLFWSMTERERRRLLTALALLVVLGISVWAMMLDAGEAKAVNATWYGPGFYGFKTASGETYTGQDATAASDIYPIGTVVHVEGPNGKSMPVRVNDLCACGGLDLSESAAEAIGVKELGRAEVMVHGTTSVDEVADTTSDSSSSTSSVSADSSGSYGEDYGSVETDEELPSTGGAPELLRALKIAS